MTNNGIHEDDFPECLAPEWLASTGESQCSYHSDRIQNLLIAIPPKGTRIGKHCATLLSGFGFRRSGKHLYRPHCPDCKQCVSVRVSVNDFVADRTMKRCLRKNSDLRMKLLEPEFVREHYELLRKYLRVRHGSYESCTNEQEYKIYYLDTAGQTQFFEYRDANNKLIMVAITDIFKDGLSSVYTFYDPDEMERSPGTLSILRQIEETKKRALPYLYLGYYIEDVPNMTYKQRFQPLQKYVDENWRNY